MSGTGGRSRSARETAAAATGELVALPVSEPVRPEDRHLGDRLAAFVDGELGHDARERVLVHLADCDACRCAADEQRRMKGLLSGLDTPGPGAGLMARLLELPDVPEEPRGPSASARAPRELPGLPPERDGGELLAAAGQMAARVFRSPAPAGRPLAPMPAAAALAAPGAAAAHGPAGRHRRLALVAAFSAAAVALSGVVGAAGSGEFGGDDGGTRARAADRGTLAADRNEAAAHRIPLGVRDPNTRTLDGRSMPRSAGEGASAGSTRSAGMPRPRPLLAGGGDEPVALHSARRGSPLLTLSPGGQAAWSGVQRAGGGFPTTSSPNSAFPSGSFGRGAGFPSASPRTAHAEPNSRGTALSDAAWLHGPFGNHHPQPLR